jgi:hypothetical protein
MYIDDNKNIEIFPRSKCFIVSFMHTLFKKESLIFLYHIRDRNFRVAICPKEESVTTHLEI